jgi:hypothetical protein
VQLGQAEWDERRVSSTFKGDSLAKGRKTATEKQRVEEGIFRRGEDNPCK